MRFKLSIIWIVIVLAALSNSATAGTSWSGGIAVDGRLASTINNPAGLSGVTTPEFSLKLLMSEGQGNSYGLYYTEPDYGTGAGLLAFDYFDPVWQIEYAVASQVLDMANAGLALRYLSNPDTEDSYVSTDLGLQVGDFWLLRFGLLVENIWHLPLGDTEQRLDTNVVAGASVNLMDYGYLNVELDNLFALNGDSQLFVSSEINPLDPLWLKVGWGPDFTIGLGYEYKQIRLDYDWRPGKHQLSFGWSF